MARRERLLILLCLLFAAGMFITGISWGLPSREVDVFLFGNRTPWTGAEILALAPIRDDPTRGADVDLNPLADRSGPILLNGTDAQRAEIVRRYRLFSYQPDEWNTMRSLAGMKPGRFQLDPRLYQYGGLWVYPVGALLKIASIPRWVHLTADLAFYLDHPEAFARFYVVARLYSAAWGVVGAWAVYWLARKLAGHMLPAAVACAGWACMPVIVTMAHEAKPHLAGLSLMLLAILAATRYVETGATRWWAAAGALCGAALGMVVSSAIIFVILPTMALLRPMPLKRRVRVALLAGLVGAGVYLVTNPYVPINAIANRDVLRSNLGTSTAMYHASPGGGFVNAIRLAAEGTSPVLAGMGLLGAVALPFAWRGRLARAEFNANAGETVAPRAEDANRAGRFSRPVPRHALWLLATPAVVVGGMFVMLAAGKPAEYARFALLPDTALCLAAVAAGWTIPRTRGVPALAMLAVFVAVAPRGAVYLAHFIADASNQPGRLRYADDLRLYNRAGLTRLAVVAEPAPYAMPPVDLWNWEIILLPRAAESPLVLAERAGAQVIIRARDEKPERVDDGLWGTGSLVETPLRQVAPISWAAKPFEVLVARRPGASPAAGWAGEAATSPSPAPARP